MAHLETDVPEHVEDALDYGAQERAELLGRFLVEEHDVHGAERIELPAAITTQGNERQPANGSAAVGFFHGGPEQVPQHHVHEAGALRANLSPTAAAVVL